MRHMPAASLALALAVTLMGTSATAGTADNPEVTDATGDANAFSSITSDEGDTRPVSFDSLDLLAVWYETAYDTNKILDPATGRITRVEHVPTALQIHISTQSPIHPTWQGRNVGYQIPVALPSCQAYFELTASAAGPTSDTSTIWASTAGCPNKSPGQGIPSQVPPSFQGNVATITFSLHQTGMNDFISHGTTIQGSSARTIALSSIANTRLIADTASEGRPFTIGQDVPPDVDCSAQPDDPQCQT